MGKTPPIHNFFGMMAGTTRLELATSAVTETCGSRQPLGLSGYAGSFLCNDLCNADDYFCVRESIAHASFSHCTLASVSFEEPDVTSYRPFMYPDWPSYRIPQNPFQNNFRLCRPSRTSCLRKPKLHNALLNRRALEKV